jgi:hypothetical protein
VISELVKQADRNRHLGANEGVPGLINNEGMAFTFNIEVY